MLMKFIVYFLALKVIKTNKKIYCVLQRWIDVTRKIDVFECFSS
jgi:hypothetical protein